MAERVGTGHWREKPAISHASPRRTKEMVTPAAGPSRMVSGPAVSTAGSGKLSIQRWPRGSCSSPRRRPSSTVRHQFPGPRLPPPC